MALAQAPSSMKLLELRPLRASLMQVTLEVMMLAQKPLPQPPCGVDGGVADEDDFNGAAFSMIFIAFTLLRVPGALRLRV